MIVTLDEAKQYARIDGNVDDALVSGLIDAAELYLSNAGIEAGPAPAALYRLAVCGLVLHWYDNRDAVDTSSPQDFEPGLRKLINQLKIACQLDASACLGVGGF